jgi:hypothetical protein
MATKRGKKKAAKKAARKRAARKSTKRTPKRAARKSAKRARRAAPKRAKRRAPKRAKRRAPKRRAARKIARKAARKTAKRRPAKRPKLKVVKRAARPKAAKAAKAAKAPRPARPAAFAAAKAAASAKELALFELERARVALHAAIQGMSEATANTPMGPGRWTPRQLVLHLVAWDREALGLLETAYTRNQRPALSADENDAANAARVAALEHHGWEETRRLLQHARADLREAFEAIPEQPADVWSPDHAVGWFARFLAGHDWHHAEALKAARVAEAMEGPA